MSVVDGRVARGDATRRRVLGRTMDIASVEGLDALSIGRLAGELSLSKSGVFALFGSKEELQLATVRAAARVFHDVVVAPALVPPPGSGRLTLLVEGWVAYSRDRVFRGGCFFQRVTAEHAGRPGPVRDAIHDVLTRWDGFLRTTILEAQSAGELRPDEDATGLAFELRALLETANADSVLHGADDVYEQALDIAHRRLAGAAVPPS